LVGAGIGEARDQPKPGFSDARPGAIDERQLQQRCIDRPLGDQLLHFVQYIRTFPSKPIDKISRGENTSHRAVSKRERIVASKKVAPRAEPTSEGRRQPSAGWKRRHGDKVGRITGDTGKSAEDREGGGWVRSSEEAE